MLRDNGVPRPSAAANLSPQTIRGGATTMCDGGSGVPPVLPAMRGQAFPAGERRTDVSPASDNGRTGGGQRNAGGDPNVSETPHDLAAVRAVCPADGDAPPPD